MTVKEDLPDASPPPLATATATASDNANSANNNSNAEIPVAEAIPIPVPPPSDSKVVKKTTKTTKTYTIPAPSGSASGASGSGSGAAAATPSAPPAENNNNSSSGVVTSGTPVASATFNTHNTTSNSSKLLSDLGRQPVSITCPHCGQVGLTRVDNRCDAGSGASAVMLGVVGCFCCICLAFAALLPCCVDKMKMTTHRCGKCNRVVGKVRSFSDC